MMALDVNIWSGATRKDEVPASSGGNHPRIQCSKSLVPPSIVKLSNNRVVLSWRATRGQHSIRTVVPESSTDDREWSRLEEDTGRHARRQRQGPARGVQHSADKTSVVHVLEVDHVELQTCAGCPRCIHGEDDGEEDEEEAEARPCEPSCWRSVYQGHDRRCQIDLGNGNALHYFRLLVRARVPPPERRGCMRPTQAEYGTGRVSEKPSGERGGGSFASPFSPGRTSPRSRRRDEPNDDDGVSMTIPGGVGGARGQLERVAHDDGEAAPKAAGHQVLWFASDPVFVDSRPPPVVLHGIGTALVLTWPPLTGLSGAEQVSYILEQWSHGVASPTPPPSWAREGAAGVSGGNHHEGDPVELGSRRRPRRRRHHHRHHHHHHPTPPKQVDAKEVFSVGTRCWFMPTRLQPGKRYWYRLGLIHEGGASARGPWVSHLTSVAPPCCVDVGSQGLVLSFPRALDGTDSPELRNGAELGAGAEGCVLSAGDARLTTGETPTVVGAGQERLGAEDLKTQAGAGSSVNRDTEGKEHLGAGQEDGGATGKHEEEQPATPMVWYTLQGLTRASGWIVLYRGPAPEVIVEGLPPNTLTKFRVGIDVDITELRHRSLGLLASLELGPPSPNVDATTGATAAGPTAERTPADTATGTRPLSPTRDTLRHGLLSPPKSVVARPALRLCSTAAAGTSSAPTSLVQRGSGTTVKYPVEQRRRSWSPLTSPAMSRMKREGFAVHDVAATVGGGFYLERPLLSWGRLQGHRGGAVWECGTNGDGGGPGERPQCREFSAAREFSTAPMPPRFAAFVADGIPQVKLWWARPRPDEGFPVSSTQTRPSTAPSSMEGGALADNCRQDGLFSPTGTSGPILSPGHERPSTADWTPSSRNHDASSAPAEAADRPHLGAGGGGNSGATSPDRRNSVFTLDVLRPSADAGGGTAAQLIHAGPELWAGLGRPSDHPSSASGIGVPSPLAASTAYSVRLSRSTATGQPASTVEGVVVTAPPPPVLEPATAERHEAPPGAVAGEGVGAVTLKVVWSTAVDNSFLPVGVEPPPVSYALEMAHACEAGPPSAGLGGTAAKAVQKVARGRRAPPDVSPVTGAAPAAAAGRPSSPNKTRPATTAKDIPVRKDPGVGQCWTLGASSWGRPRARADQFRIVWRAGEEEQAANGGEMEARTPPLPPGMRFAFRVRAECCFGVAVSAVTVYQTALVAPVPPKGLRACIATHESRAGNFSKCVRLLWDPFHPEHGKNVVTLFTVQARRPRPSPGGQALLGANRPSPPTVGRSWQDVCSTPGIGCLDPGTLGAAHVVAEYRVRAEGPGGKGPWCEPLRVDLLVPAPDIDSGGGEDRLPANDFGGASGDGSGAVSSVTCAAREERRGAPPSSSRQPMEFFRPGTRPRCSLTGDARRPRARQTNGAGAAARTMPVVAQEDKRRAGSSSQIWWGELASPRMLDGFSMLATSQTAGAAPWESGFRAASGGINDETRGEGTAIGGDSSPEYHRGATPMDGPLASTGLAAAVPRGLAAMLRGELDVACRLGCPAAGPSEGGTRVSEGGGGQAGEEGTQVVGLSADGLYRRNPDCPVVPWITPLPALDGQSEGGGSRPRQQGHRRNHQPQRRRRRRRTPGASRRTSPHGGLVGDVFVTPVPQQRRQRRQRAGNRSKSPFDCHRSRPSVASGEIDGPGGRRAQQVSIRAGNLNATETQ